jgi:hypothetical protein
MRTTKEERALWRATLVAEGWLDPKDMPARRTLRAINYGATANTCDYGPIEEAVRGMAEKHYEGVEEGIRLNPRS